MFQRLFTIIGLSVIYAAGLATLCAFIGSVVQVRVNTVSKAATRICFF